jgi:hypothetical protein
MTGHPRWLIRSCDSSLLGIANLCNIISLFN